MPVTRIKRNRKHKHYPVLWVSTRPAVEATSTHPTHATPGDTNRHGRSKTAFNVPRKNTAASNLFDLLGGRDGVMDLLEETQDEKLITLRQLIESDDTAGVRVDGQPRMSFGKMLAVSGATEESVYKLFLSRKRAETVVTLAAAEPKIAKELIELSSNRLVQCRVCAGTKWAPSEDDDEPPRPCKACNSDGMQLIEGDFKGRELFFDLSKLKSHDPIVQVNNDNRSVSFQVGMPGTAPNPLATIRSLEQVRDAGPKALPPASVNPLEQQSQLPIQEAELVNK